MELTPVKTRRLEPPRDDLLAVLDEVLPKLEERDVVVITSKAVAIHEGRCVPHEGPEAKRKLVEAESDHIVKTPTEGGWDLTVKNHMVAFAGGVDESNVGDWLVLLPEDPMRSAFSIREHLRARHGVTELGVILTDSSGVPYREGTIALSIGHAGFAPVNDKVGTKDLFGRPFRYTYVNVVDALAVAAGFAMGETDESTPVCLVRDIPHIEFTDEDRSKELLIRPEDDVYYPVLRGTYD